MSWAGWFAALCAGLILVVAVLDQIGFWRWWWFPAGLTAGELRSMRGFPDPAGPVQKFYEWRQDQWRRLAQGAAAAIITLVVAVVGLSLDASKVVRETTAGDSESKTTVTSANVPASLYPLIGALLVVGVLAWMHAFALQRRMTRDLEEMPD